MAVPFAFPEENNDVEVIIRQLGLLLNRLAVEFKKQRNENNQLRARNKLQSRIGQPVQQPSVDIATNSATVGDTLLNAIAACKRFATPDGSVIAVTPRREFDDAKNDSTAHSFEKTELCRTDNSSTLTEGAGVKLNYLIHEMTELGDQKNEKSDKTNMKYQLNKLRDFQIEEEQTPPPSFFRSIVQTQRLWWSWLAPSTLTRNPFWTTAVICVVGWHLLR